MKKTVYVYAGRSDDNKKVFVEKKFLEMDDSKTKQLMNKFNGMVAFAKEAGYTVVDVSQEPFDSKTVIVGNQMAQEIANLQQGKKKR